jgi:hypothetical protein
MKDRRIAWFIRFCDKQERVDQFLAGNLFLNRLSYFKGIEDQNDITRRDTSEAAWAWLQPEGLEINLTVPGIGDVKLTGRDLASPVSMSFDAHENLHVYCMYAVHFPNVLPSETGKIELTPSQIAEMQAALVVDDRCREFGRYGVIVRADPFLERLKNVLQARRQWFKGELVEYYDDTTFNGNFEPRDAPFRKQQRFSYQQEFRVCVNTGTTGSDPLRVTIGDISDIAAVLETDKINGSFQLNFD